MSARAQRTRLEVVIPPTTIIHNNNSTAAAPAESTTVAPSSISNVSYTSPSRSSTTNHTTPGRISVPTSTFGTSAFLNPPILPGTSAGKKLQQGGQQQTNFSTVQESRSPQRNRLYGGVNSHLISLDNFEAVLLQAAGPDGVLSGRVDITSPRSLQVCAIHGIDPNELMPFSVQYFERTLTPALTHNAFGQQVRVEPGTADRKILAQQRYDNYEARRQDKLRLLRAAREQYISNELVASVEGTQPDQVAFMAVVPATSPGREMRSRSAAAHGGRGNVSTTEVLMKERDAYLLDRFERQRTMEQKRKEVLERASQLKEIQQEYILSQQIAKEQQHAEQFRQRLWERQQKSEVKRMKQEKQRELVDRARRQQEFFFDQHRTAVAENIVHRDPYTALDGNKALAKEVQRYRIQAAKLQYLTPRQRDTMPRPKSVSAVHNRQQ
eukprot:PhF_6_TR19935/c0_g1_i2/m.29006